MPVLPLYCQQGIPTFRHPPYSPVGVLELHSFGHKVAAYLWLHHKRVNTLEEDEVYQIQGAVDAIGIEIRCDIKQQALAPEQMSKVEVQTTGSVVANFPRYFQVALYNCFFQHEAWIFVLKYLEGVAIWEILSFAIRLHEKM